MGRNITPTIEGGLLVAITVILGLVTVYVPILGILVEFFCAVPIAVLTARQGADKGFMALTVSTILLVMLIGPFAALRLMLSFGVCGVTLGLCVRKNFDAIKIFLMTLIVASVAQILSIILLLVLMDVNFIQMQIELLRESFTETFGIYESLGVDKERIAESKQQVEAGLETMTFLIPTLILLSSVMNAAAVWFTSKWIFPKLQMKLPPFPPFSQWRFPAVFMYLAAFGVLGIYWGYTRSWTQIYEISLNLTIAAMLVGLVQGLSLLSFVFDRYKVSKFLRWIFYLMLLVNLFFAQIVAVTGLIDMQFDYRKKFFDGR